MMSKEFTPYVVQTAEGSWRVNGTRVSLDSIVQAYWAGRQPELVVADFPSLTLEQVHGAIAHYLRNRSEFDAYLATHAATWKRLQVESNDRNGPLINRIRDAAVESIGE